MAVMLYWDASSQVGPETPLLNPGSSPFAVHVRDVTETVSIDDSVLSIDFPEQQFYDNAWNWGWWSIYLVILYESPTITTPVCVRLYTADQNQDYIQNYTFEKPVFLDQSPVLFSLFAARLNSVDEDKSRVQINDMILGDIKGDDLTVPETIGTQGHFYYEAGYAQGLNGDTANFRFIDHDGVAIVNDK